MIYSLRDWIILVKLSQNGMFIVYCSHYGTRDKVKIIITKNIYRATCNIVKYNYGLKIL